MPTYSYKCDACEHEFDKEQRITEKPLKKCPKCGKMKARRMISLEGPGFILKGGGWESDLYSGPSNATSSSSSSSSESSSSDSSSSSSSSSSSDSSSDD